MSTPSIVVTGLGMHSSVGACAEQTCAAVRAGVNRFAKWPWFAPDAGADEEEEDGPAGVTAAAIEPDMGNGSWIEKTVPLLLQPFLEAIWQAQLLDSGEPSTPISIHVYVATPYIDRATTDQDFGNELADLVDDVEVMDIDTGDELEIGSEAPSAQDSMSPGYKRFVVLVNEIVASVVQATVTFFPNDHAAGGAALSHAVADLQAGQANVGIVVGLDSLLDTGHLEFLVDSGYLKTATNPTGAIPGEGAAVVVVETSAHALKRGVTPLAGLGPVGAAMEKYAIGDDQPITANALSSALRTAIEAAGGAAQFRHVMVDLNGQRARFIEWATVETRCMHLFPRGWTLDHPADCMGDLGAAFVPMAIGLVARGLHRGYVKSPTIICCSSLRGERVALSVFPWER